MVRLALIAALALALSGSSTAASSQQLDWPEFGYTSARANVGPASTGITAANVAHLHRRQIQIDGTVDSTPIYLHDAQVDGAPHDTIFVTTTYGKTEAIDANSGKVLWRFTPSSYSSLAGSAQITTMAPVVDPSGTAIYAGAPDGYIRKLSVANGKVLWATSITRDPTHEKLSAALNFGNGLVLAATDGFIGDPPPYQGHVVTMNPANGHIVGIWNSLCSNRTGLIQPSTCSGSDSAIFGRSAPVVDPANGDLLVATGNGPFNGSTEWGDSALVLTPQGNRLLKHWTPTDQQELDDGDVDLGSTAPALLEDGYFVQGGKDGRIRLLQLSKLAGVNGTLGGELQTVVDPGGTELYSEPCIWKGTWVFVADSDGTAAWVLRGGRLHAVWSNGNDGTSPVLAGGLLYIQGNGQLRVYEPSNGHELADLPIGEDHWQSPIVVDGRVIAAEGNSNDHNTSSGVLDVYTP
jgi:outer membrane protein assembly factor BamB